MYGYEALPTAVGSGDNPTHSVTKVVLDGKIYYCDYTWIGENDTDRYMFMTNDNMIFRDHKNPISDDMGQKIAYNGIERNLSKIKIDKIKNKRNNKISISFTDLKTDGYELQYTTDKKFKKTKQKIVTRSNVTIIGLRKRKKYYVRVRPYGVIYMSCINGKSKRLSTMVNGQKQKVL